MKGDIAFVGFMLTADDWRELDAQSRAQLIAVATRQPDPSTAEKPRRFPEGTGKHEIVESLDDELDALIVDRDDDAILFVDDAFTCDFTAEYDAVEEWLAFQPEYDHADLDEGGVLPPAPAPVEMFEDFADWADL